ncbi:hypothetical protein ADZ36_04175 [Streptomyces fradiae]|uniref:Uncharacterized protein n=1 Tax=Streptomyces fradiae TaxID=1906 RepID=A0ACC4WGB4_STRFR|nr:hypothetical protein ADZ36_04175 [Streptomyces fradiae]OFA34104.1 hypothetical protein BEN35_31010 [Streptomyces fradiae]
MADLQAEVGHWARSALIQISLYQPTHWTERVTLGEHMDTESGTEVRREGGLRWRRATGAAATAAESGARAGAGVAQGAPGTGAEASAGVESAAV